jgi:cell wall-associated NlpC family hydrolase
MKANIIAAGLGLLQAFLLFFNLSCASTTRFSAKPDSGMSLKARDWVPIDKEKIMASVKKFEGIPYLWGGESKKGMDCSGLVKSVFWDLERITLPHQASEQAGYGVKISRAALQCGDLVFFRIHGMRVDHVGIYLGEGNFVHASRGSGVTVTSMEDDYYQERFAFAKRLYYG